MFVSVVGVEKPLRLSYSPSRQYFWNCLRQNLAVEQQPPFLSHIEDLPKQVSTSKQVVCWLARLQKAEHLSHRETQKQRQQSRVDLGTRRYGARSN
jgi:hypothetical protein